MNEVVSGLGLGIWRGWCMDSPIGVVTSIEAQQEPDATPTEPRQNPDRRMEMAEMARLFAHSAWATMTSMDVAGEVPVAKRQEARNGAYQSIDGILTHLVDTERSFLAAVRGEPVPPDGGGDGTLEGACDAFAEVADGWAAWFATPAARDDGHGVYIPWFEQEVPQGDVLMQVLLHTTQHRSDALLLASMEGVEVPPTDFVLWQLGYVGGGGGSGGG